MKEEDRIYVILPKTVQFLGREPGARSRRKVPRSLVLPHGMLSAQAAHVVSLMRVELSMTGGDSYYKSARPVTTITLSVRNSRELEKIWKEFHEHFGSREGMVWDFFDTNKTLYGGGAEVRTAICTRPVKRSQVDEVIGHLELL